MKIIQSYNPNIVLTSYGIAFLGSYVAICLCEQLRSSYLHGHQHNLWIKIPWLLAIGCSLGGVGIWCMHFIGMSALTLRDESTNQTIDIGYNVGESLASLIIVIVFIGIATTIASNDLLFAKSKKEILEMFILQAHHMSLQEIKHIHTTKVIWLITTKKLFYLVVGGMVAAGGVCIMHYIGMDAMEFNQPILIKWNSSVVFASVLIAILAAIVAYWILFRFLSIYPAMESLRLASAMIMGIAVCGMHYIGMIAASFEYIQTSSNSFSNHYTTNHIPMEQVMIPILLSAFIVLWILVILVLFDLRRLILKYRHFIQHFKGMSASGVVSSNHNVGSSHGVGFLLNSRSVFEQMDDNNDNNDNHHNHKQHLFQKKPIHPLESKLPEVIPSFYSFSRQNSLPLLPHNNNNMNHNNNHNHNDMNIINNDNNMNHKDMNVISYSSSEDLV